MQQFMSYRVNRETKKKAQLSLKWNRPY